MYLGTTLKIPGILGVSLGDPTQEGGLVAGGRDHTNTYIHIYMCICIYTYIDISLCTYIYIYIHVSLCTHTYIYIYMYLS